MKFTSLRNYGLGKLSSLAASSALILGLASFTDPAAAQSFDAVKHFRGKTINIIVDFKPGGGTDTQARYFAKEWGKFIPGSPRIVVRNLIPSPAGRAFVAASKPDGLTLSFLASLGIGLELTDPSLKFTTDGWQFIGSHAARDLVLFGSGKLPYKDLKAAAGGKEKIFFVERIGRPQDVSGRHMAIFLAHDWLNAPLQVLPIAASGTTPTLLAIERGDSNAMALGSQWYTMVRRRKGWLKEGKLKPLANLGNPDIKLSHNKEIGGDIPHIHSWLTAAQRKVWDGIVAPEVLAGKTIAAHNDTPPAIVKVLRDAYLKAVNDDTFKKGLIKLQRVPLDLIPGEKLQGQVKAAHAAFKAQLPTFQRLQKEMHAKYVKGR
jgi:tripartite-type tricarboxylate transporter receptor subunit TctC